MSQGAALPSKPGKGGLGEVRTKSCSHGCHRCTNCGKGQGGWPEGEGPKGEGGLGKGAREGAVLGFG